MRVYTRCWWEYPDALIEAGKKAMETHSSLEERQARADCWYADCQSKFMNELESKGINTDAKKVQNG
jgi:O-glycosyl hydrolase